MHSVISIYLDTLCIYVCSMLYVYGHDCPMSVTCSPCRAAEPCVNEQGWESQNNSRGGPGIVLQCLFCDTLILWLLWSLSQPNVKGLCSDSVPLWGSISHIFTPFCSKKVIFSFYPPAHFILVAAQKKGNDSGSSSLLFSCLMYVRQSCEHSQNLALWCSKIFWIKPVRNASEMIPWQVFNTLYV